MTVYFQKIAAKRFYITFGIESEIHSQVYLLTYGWEYLNENGDVEFATLTGWFRHPKYWKTKLI